MKALLPLAAVLLGGCVSTGPVITDKAPCSTLIASSLRDDVPGARLAPTPPKPAEPRNTEAYTGWLEDMLTVWQGFALGQTAALKQANEEKSVVIETQEDCEARDAAAIERARPKFLGVF